MHVGRVSFGLFVSCPEGERLASMSPREWE